MGIITLLMLNGFAQSVLATASSTGTGYNEQWQYAMDWVRENTPEDAVFAHWWDYGYYVQTGGQRATLSDGGNANPTINYLTGRYLLTGQDDMEALQVLGSRNATHVLAVSDEIGKYGAFSAIGSDANFDRLSSINTFVLDPSLSQETRNGSILGYSGSSLLTHDIVVDNRIYSAFSAGIFSVNIPVSYDANGTLTSIEQPTVYIADNSASATLSVRCLFYDGQEIIFEEADIESCVQVIYSFDGVNMNLGGAVLYLPERAWDSWFTEHYLFGKESKYFTLVYSDETTVALSYYNGYVYGPLKIWEVTYPEDLVIPEEYMSGILPEGVEELGFLEEYLVPG